MVNAQSPTHGEIVMTAARILGGLTHEMLTKMRYQLGDDKHPARVPDGFDFNDSLPHFEALLEAVLSQAVIEARQPISHA